MDRQFYLYHLPVCLKFNDVEQNEQTQQHYKKIGETFIIIIIIIIIK
jgi:hypothetical protein